MHFQVVSSEIEISKPNKKAFFCSMTNVIKRKSAEDYNENMKTIQPGEQALTVQHPLFQLLISEHAKITEKLQQLTAESLTHEDLEWLWVNAETNHHEREEKILFNFLLPDKRVDGGGPLCMLYMDGYIMQPPLDRARAITGTEPPLEEHQINIFESGSAMRIPINEHRAGKDILRFLREKWETLSPEVKRRAFEEYRRIQSENIKKEESCFFCMCSSLLSVQQADELFKKFV